jgi:LruC domain-containing protein
MAFNPSDGMVYLSNKKEIYSYDPSIAKYMSKYILTGDSNSDSGGDLCISEDGEMYIVSKMLYKVVLDGNINKATRVGSALSAAVNGADIGSDGFIYAGKGNGIIYRIDPSTGSNEQVFDFKITIGDFAIAKKDAVQQDPDMDGDGVPNESDDYPEDAQKAFNSYYPGQKSFGTLAFEDLWPSKGDYDFNDMVIDYRFKHIKNASNLIVQLDITIQLRAIGGSLHNGFGIQLPISSDLISSINTDFSFTAENVTLDEKGLESNQNNATVIFFEDGFNVLQHPGQGTGINTDPLNPYVDPAQIVLNISFSQPISMQQLGNAPNNPFIFSSTERGKEIHLPGYAPTNLADASYFGTADDATNPAKGYYYKNPNGLPWGMNIPTNFIYPIEKLEIIEGYTNFAQWASSGGFSFMDWYEEKEGYRNKSKLYINPN